MRFLIQLMFWNKSKHKDADVMIRHGDTNEFYIETGTVTEATTAGMRVKNGYNSVEGKYFIQLTDKKTLESMRVYMDEEFYKNFHYNMGRAIGFTQEPESFSGIPGSNPSTHHLLIENNPEKEKISDT